MRNRAFGAQSDCQRIEVEQRVWECITPELSVEEKLQELHW